MRFRSVICSLLAAGLLISSSQAQTGDWQAVQDIPVGSYISVKSYPRSARCFFVNATDWELFCEQRGLRIDFHRQNIRQVRLEHPNKNALLGVLIGTGLGAGVAAAVTRNSNDAETRVADPIIFGILGAVVSGVLMHRISPVPGNIVYRK